MSGNNCFIRILEDKIFYFFNKKLNTQNIAHLKKNLQNFELWTLLFFRWQIFFLSSSFSLKSRMNFYKEMDLIKLCAFTFFVVFFESIFFGRNRALISTNLESILTSFIMFCLISYVAQSFFRDHFKGFWKSETGKSYPSN